MNVEELSGELKKVKPNKDFSVFLVCFLIASIFWLLNAFTKEYSTIIEVPVSYSNIPQDRVLSKTLPELAKVEVNGTGFRLLSLSFLNSPDPIQVDFDKGRQSASSRKEVSSFGPDYFRGQLMSEIPSEISLGEISIDSLKIVVEDKATKEVALKPNINFTVKHPYFLNGRVEVEPSTVLVEGVHSVVDNMDSLMTTYFDAGELNKRLVKELDLELPQGIASKQNIVSVTIPIDQYTEGKMEVPISIENLPANQSLILFPSKVEITYLAGLGDFENIRKEDFVFEVDANEIHKGKTTLLVKYTSTSKLARVQEFKPHKVEFILKK